MHQHFKKVCSNCGSTNVVKDAWAEWNQENQRWELGDIFDDGYCRDCDATGNAVVLDVKIDTPHQGPVCIVDAAGVHPSALDQAVEEQRTYYSKGEMK